MGKKFDRLFTHAYLVVTAHKLNDVAGLRQALAGLAEVVEVQIDKVELGEIIGHVAKEGDK